MLIGITKTKQRLKRQVFRLYLNCQMCSQFRRTVADCPKLLDQEQKTGPRYMKLERTENGWKICIRSMEEIKQHHRILCAPQRVENPLTRWRHVYAVYVCMWRPHASEKEISAFTVSQFGAKNFVAIKY